jgi:protocatechuate 3,4-dioxygenase beta subunit
MRRLLCLALGLTALTTPSSVNAQEVVFFGDGSTPVQQSPNAQRAQPTRTIAVGTASISGVVTAADTGRPLRNARVILSGTAGPPRGDGAGGAIPQPPANPPLANDNIGVNRSTLTNAQGRFTFDRLAAGRYSVSAQRDSYLSGGYGQKRVGGPSGSFLLTDGQRLTLSIPMQRGGVITGQVFDEDGEPVRGAQIQVWRSMMSNGTRRFQQTNGYQTDDRGMFRAFGLEPGDYRVAAMARNNDRAVADQMQSEKALVDAAIAAGQVKTGAAAGYPSYVTITPVPNPGGATTVFMPVYAPSTVVAADASIIHVDANQEHGPVTIHLQYVQATTIHGIVSAVPPNLQLRVSLISADAGGGVSNSFSPQANGEFTFRNISPGRYRLLAQTTPRPQPVQVGDNITLRSAPGDVSTTFWAEQEVIVQGQDLEVGLSLRPSRTISGVVVSEMSGASGSQPRQAQLTLAPNSNPGIGGSQLQSQIDGNGRFTFSGVVPGKYVLRVNPGTMKSSVIEGEDTLDIPFEFAGDRDITDAVVTVMDQSKRPTLWGVVADAGGKAVGDVTVVIASTDERFWLPGNRRIATMRTDPWGRYRTENLPAGAYYVATVRELENGEQYDPEMLRTVAARGSRVTLNEAAVTRQDFKMR